MSTFCMLKSILGCILQRDFSSCHNFELHGAVCFIWTVIIENVCNYLPSAEHWTPTIAYCSVAVMLCDIVKKCNIQRRMWSTTKMLSSVGNCCYKLMNETKRKLVGSALWYPGLLEKKEFIR